MKNNKRQVIDALTAKLMEQARCKFECEGGHLCGLQQRKFDDGSQTTLKGVWRGPVFKGFVCDKHQPQIPQNRTFRTLRAIASLIAEHSLSLPGVVVDTLPESIHPPRNGDGGQGKRRRRRNRGHKHGRKSEAPHEERKAEPSATHSSATLGAGNASKPEPTPAAQKPVTAETPKATASQSPIILGGRWRFLVEKLGLSSVVFEMAVRLATKSEGKTTFLQALLLTKEGREVLIHCRDIISLGNPEVVAIVRPLLAEEWVGWFDRLTYRTTRDQQHLITQLVQRPRGCKALEKSGLEHLIKTVKEARARAKRLAWKAGVARRSRQHKKTTGSPTSLARAA